MTFEQIVAMSQAEFDMRGDVQEQLAQRYDMVAREKMDCAEIIWKKIKEDRSMSVFFGQVLAERLDSLANFIRLGVEARASAMSIRQDAATEKNYRIQSGVQK